MVWAGGQVHGKGRTVVDPWGLRWPSAGELHAVELVQYGLWSPPSAVTHPWVLFVDLAFRFSTMHVFARTRVQFVHRACEGQQSPPELPFVSGPRGLAQCAGVPGYRFSWLSVTGPPLTLGETRYPSGGGPG